MIDDTVAATVGAAPVVDVRITFGGVEFGRVIANTTDPASIGFFLTMTFGVWLAISALRVARRQFPS